jgi:hypothetical protein
MTICKGMVQDTMVLLEAGVQLPGWRCVVGSPGWARFP